MCLGGLPKKNLIAIMQQKTAAGVQKYPCHQVFIISFDRGLPGRTKPFVRFFNSNYYREVENIRQSSVSERCFQHMKKNLPLLNTKSVDKTGNMVRAPSIDKSKMAKILKEVKSESMYNACSINISVLNQPDFTQTTRQVAEILSLVICLV